MEDLSQKVLNKIKEENLCPTPRWQFLCKNWFVWILGVLALLIGALATSVVMFMILNNEWDLATYVSSSRALFVASTLPYAWIILLVAFIFLADYQIRNTKSGYRINTLYLITGSLGLSVMLGGVFYIAGAGEIIDDAFIKHVPYYSEIGNRRAHIMMQPQRGIVGGLIVNVNGRMFDMRAVDRTEWKVDSTNAEFIGSVQIMPGRHVVVIGENSKPNFIEAKFVKELLPGNGQRKLSPPELERIRLELRNR
jgi:hypothetical protein